MEAVAYKLASPMLHLVTKELGSVLMEKTLEIWQVDDKLRELQATYLQIEALLAQLGHCRQQVNPTMEPWLLDLERYCYDTEDLVDDLILSRQYEKEKDEKPSQNPVRFHIFRSGRLTMAHQIGGLLKKLKDIGNVIEQLLSSGAVYQSAEPSIVNHGRSLLSDQTSLALGTSRDKDKQRIIEKLISSVNQSDSCGVSIIGMDGLGKTALARSILNDEAIRHHFPLVISASVSGRFQMEDAIKDLVADRADMRNLKEVLCSSGRSLIVLDDLWSVNDEDWDFFKCNYLSSGQDWSILTTTRNPKVAEVTETAPYFLNTLTQEDCKKLIMHRARLSAAESETWSSDIDVIASKCKGMPIIANKFGLRLSKKEKRKSNIVQFKMTELSQLQDFREVFLSLNLNKPRLPPYLMRCLAYFSLFPPNHEFSKDEMVQLWEAEGFIQHQHTTSSKDALNQCFDELLSRSILRPIEYTDNTSIQCIKCMNSTMSLLALLLPRHFGR